MDPTGRKNGGKKVRGKHQELCVALKTELDVDALGQTGGGSSALRLRTALGTLDQAQAARRDPNHVFQNWSEEISSVKLEMIQEDEASRFRNRKSHPHDTTSQTPSSSIADTIPDMLDWRKPNGGWTDADRKCLHWKKELCRVNGRTESEGNQSGNHDTMNEADASSSVNSITEMVVMQASGVPAFSDPGEADSYKVSSSFGLNQPPPENVKLSLIERPLTPTNGNMALPQPEQVAQYKLSKMAPADGIILAMKCVGCKNVPAVPPVITCKIGHTFCVNCLQTETTCLSESSSGPCGERFVFGQSKLFEYLNNHSVFGCPNASIGCEKKLIGSQLRNHRKKCSFKSDVECPFKACPAEWISEALLLEHIISHGGAFVNTSSGFYRIRVDSRKINFKLKKGKSPPKETRWVEVILRIEDLHFMFIVQVAKSSVFMWCSHMSGKIQVQGRNFQSRISLHSPDYRSRKMWVGPVATLDQRHNEVSEVGDCLEVYKSVILSTCSYKHWGNDCFNVDIKISEQPKKYSTAEIPKLRTIPGTRNVSLVKTPALPAPTVNMNMKTHVSSGIFSEAFRVQMLELVEGKTSEGQNFFNVLLPAPSVLKQTADVDKSDEALVPGSVSSIPDAHNLDNMLVTDTAPETSDADKSGIELEGPSRFCPEKAEDIMDPPQEELE